ncbi:hypothetical protein EKH57_17980 (plasmid) [Halorubrum sp. BOL3-1]|uniref:hypothetical protein n=1 Tax=Halorubrum sp. BOL3-1 TaxID=2497325 RepID=UPI0010050D59|nr:hypothetical protein [Halorubrum sp. BOL3-1]QAU14559.1 hypothetical protein EKH57_17980 [Halorubrum sp. BOL3-1]
MTMDIRDTMAELTELDFESEDTIDEALIGGFRSFQSAAVARSYESAFVRYWQCLEALTLVDPEKDRASVPPQRAGTFLNITDSQFFDDRLESLWNKRNQLVHESEPITILESDLNLLKRLADLTIDELLTFRGEHSVSEARLIMDRGGEDNETIQDEIQELEFILDWQSR